MITNTITTTTTGHFIPMNSFLKAALHYAEVMNWLVFPLKPQSKIPLTPHGFKDATRNADQIIQWWTQYPDANIAIVTGAESGLFALDVDPRNGGHEDFDHLNNELGTNLQLLDTPQSLTGSGGFHLFFQYPTTQVIRSGKLSAGIDIKGDGGYVVAPHSIHPNGRAYVWEGESDPQEGITLAPAPAKLLALLVGKAASQGATVPTYRNQWVDPKQIQELQSALATLSAEDYHDWVKVGMSLHSLGNDDIGFRLWDEWSQTSEKYDAREQGKKWRSFEVRRDLNRETIFWMAQQVGWAGELIAAPDYQPEPYTAVINDITESAPEPAKLPTTPPELLAPIGLVGDIARYITSTAPIPQPELAVAAALSVCATIIGRKFSTENDVRSNLYLLGLVTTGGGKEHPRKMIKKILASVGGSHFIGGEGLASAQGLVSATHKQPNNLFLLDEFGLFLKSIMNPNAGSHKAQILDIFLKMHSAADSTYVGDAYAQRDQQIIENPCVNLFGTSVPSNFYEALSSAHVVNGFLNRMIVCDASDSLPDLNDLVQSKPVPPEVVQWGKTALQATDPSKGNLGGISPGSPIYIPYTPDARELVKNYGKAIHAKRQSMLNNDVLSELYARRYENMIKVALVLACADSADASRATIALPHVEWAIRFIDYWGDSLVDSVRLHVADSIHDSLRKAAYNTLKRAGAKGLTEAMLVNRCRALGALDQRARSIVLSDLLALGMADQVQPQEKHLNGRTKPPAYVACDYAEKFTQITQEYTGVL